jgi:hypothetical protein
VKEEVTFRVAAQLGGTAGTIALDGSIVYLGVGQRLMAVDISDPMAPRFLGQSDALPDVVQALAVGDGVTGGLVYVGAGRDVHVFDVSDPVAPTRISTFSSLNDLEEGSWSGIIPAGEVVYTVNHVSGTDVFFTRLTAFDLRDPTQPVVTAMHDLPGHAGIAASGEVIYIAHEGKVQLVDAATFHTTLGEIGLGDAVNPYFIAVTGNLAYVGMWDYRTDKEFGEHVLLAVNVSNPAQPEVVAGPIGLPGSVAATAASGEAFFLAGAGSVHGFCPTFLQMIDIADTGPRQSTFEPQSCIIDIAVDGDRLVAATRDRGLQVFDANQANLTLAAEFVYPPGFTHVDKIALNHDVGYIISGEALRVLDRTQPAAPTVAGAPLHLSVGGGILELYVRENRLYVVGVDNPMLALDISQPASPRLVTEAGVRPGAGTWPVPALAGNVLYMPAGDTLQISDISDPANPVLVNTITPAAGTFFQSASVSDRYLIASGPDSTTNAVRLHLYNASDPFRPVTVGQFQLPDPYLLVTTMTDDTLYAITSDISQGNFYLYSLDLSDPAQPVAGGGFALPFGVQEMVAAGNTLYVIGASHLDMPEPPGGIWALDVSNHSQPYLAGQYQLLKNASPDVHGCRLCDLGVDGDRLYVAAGDAGLFVLQAEK